MLENFLLQFSKGVVRQHLKADNASDCRYPERTSEIGREADHSEDRHADALLSWEHKTNEVG